MDLPLPPTRPPARKTAGTKPAPAKRKSMNKENPQSKRNTAEAPNAATEDADESRPGNVDKIRDILFGSQMRDYEKKFSRLEERLLKETSDLREDMKRRFASLEAFIKSEVDALAERAKAEQGERADADKELARELKDANKSWEKKAGQIEDQSAKAQRELRQHILEEAKRLTEDLEEKHAAVTKSLERESQDLRGMLTDRLALADLFTEVALRLKNEFKMPGKE